LNTRFELIEVSKLVWGLPIRIFHWSLVGLICVSLYTGHFGEYDSIDTHMFAGYGVLALLLFRFSFGLFAKGYARFGQFVRGPKVIAAYVKSPEKTTGHNPLGALGVLALLFSLSVQVGTGLFATDDIFFDGPLNHLVSGDTAGVLTGIHGINQRVLMGLISLHLIAILIHEWRLGHRIVWPMVMGKKSLGNETDADRHQFGLALTCLGIGLALTYILVNKI
jgi:cytochrome b